MTDLPFSIRREIFIAARRETVFRYFQDSERFAAWWGEGSRIAGEAGGEVLIRYPNGETASGHVVESVPPERVVFTYGYDTEGKPIGPGGSRVTIELTENPRGTDLVLTHEVTDQAIADMHVPGWRYQLGVFANVAANEQHADVAERVDAYLAAWSELDEAKLRELLEAAVSDDVTFQDAHGCTRGRDELLAHIGAAQAHLGVSRLVRDGAVRQCQGTAAADWRAVHPSGQELARGVNVYTLGGDGRIRGVVGLAEVG